MNKTIIAQKGRIALVKEENKYYIIGLDISKQGQTFMLEEKVEKTDNIVLGIKKFLWYTDERTRLSQQFVEDVEEFLNEKNQLNEFCKRYPLFTKEKINYIKTGLPFWTKKINEDYETTIFKGDKK